MGARLSRRTHERRLRAYEKLGVTPEAISALPSITYFLRRKLLLTTSASMRYLRASESPEARRVVEAYDNFQIAFTEKVLVPIEAYCCAASVSPMRILEIIGGICVRQGQQQALWVAASSHPKVMKKTVDVALTDEGIKDRVLIHRITGALPMPKGSQTIINVTQGTQASTELKTFVAPPPEQMIQKLVNRFNAMRGLPPVSPVAVLPEPEPAEVGEEEADE